MMWSYISNVLRWRHTNLKVFQYDKSFEILTERKRVLFVNEKKWVIDNLFKEIWTAERHLIESYWESWFLETLFLNSFLTLRTFLFLIRWNHKFRWVKKRSVWCLVWIENLCEVNCDFEVSLLRWLPSKTFHMSSNLWIFIKWEDLSVF